MVALQNSATFRSLRDRLFQYIIDNELTSEMAERFDVPIEKLHAALELYIEGIQPEIVIFIDETNHDLEEFAEALSVPTTIFRVKKLLVDGVPKYYSPDQRAPAIETTPAEKSISGSEDLDVVAMLGGGASIPISSRSRMYRLTDGRVIYVKRSKFYDRHNYYWFGINSKSFDSVKDSGLTHVVFVLADRGFVVVSLNLIDEYLRTAQVTRNPDGSVRHYHVFISGDPNPQLFTSQDTDRLDLSDVFTPFG